MTDHNHTGDDPGHSGVVRHTPPSPEGEPSGRTRAAASGMRPAVERATLRDQDRDTVNAVQVAMERSGAERIDAQRVTLNQSGANTLSAETVELKDSGSVTLNAENATLKNSQVILANVKDLRLTDSRALVAVSGKTAVEGNGRIGLLQAGSVDTTGDVNALLVMTGSVKAGGNVNVTFTPASAGALGVAFAAALVALRWLIGRGR